MGQNVNPHALRVGVIRDWDSRWFGNPDLKVSGSVIGVVKPWEVPKRTIWSRCVGLWWAFKIAIYAVTHPPPSDKGRRLETSRCLLFSAL